MRIGIIAALPAELKPLVRGWSRLPTRGSGIYMWQTTRDGTEVIAVCGGMGEMAARRAFSAAEFAGSLDRVLSVGWAGALTEENGLSLVMSEIIDAQTGERFASGSGGRGLRVVTLATVADTAEKRRLQATYGAVVVDMEAAAVARLAQMRGIPVGCLKVVSDGVDARLPNLNFFITNSGHLKMLKFLAHVAVRPWYWRSLVEVGLRSSRGSRALAEAVEEYLAAVTSE